MKTLLEEVTQKPTRSKRAYVTLTVLFILFFGPFIVASMMYQKGQTLHVSTNNKGHLLLPPQALQSLNLAAENGKQLNLDNTVLGKWLLFYVSPAGCNEICKSNLYKMRQVNTAVGKYQSHVQRALVLGDTTAISAANHIIAEGYQGTRITTAARASLQSLFTVDTDAATEGALFVADPHGNVMMSYSPDADPMDILKDMKQLLKVSQIG